MEARPKHIGMRSNKPCAGSTIERVMVKGSSDTSGLRTASSTVLLVRNDTRRDRCDLHHAVETRAWPSQCPECQCPSQTSNARTVDEPLSFLSGWRRNEHRRGFRAGGARMATVRDRGSKARTSWRPMYIARIPPTVRTPARSSARRHISLAVAAGNADSEARLREGAARDCPAPWR